MKGKTNPKTNYLTNLKEFETYLKHDRKRAETVKTYVNTAKAFLDLISKEPKHINKDDLIKWKGYCQKFGDNSLTPRYGAVKKLIEYFEDANIINEGFYGVALRTLKAPKIQVDENNLDILVLKDDELQNLFEVSKKNNYRDYAIFKTAFWCMLRRIEILGLNYSDVDFKNKKLHLRAEITKGGKPDTINISQVCLDIIKEYWEKYRPKPNAENQDTLFIYEDRRISRNKLWEMVKIYKAMCNLPEFHFHMMRHSGITAYAKVEKDVKIVQKQARHSDAETTLRYINYTNKEHETAYNNFEKMITGNPVEKKPLDPEIIKPKEKVEPPKTMYQESNVKDRIREMELELELLRLKNEQRKYSETMIYG